MHKHIAKILTGGSMRACALLVTYLSINVLACSPVSKSDVPRRGSANTGNEAGTGSDPEDPNESDVLDADREAYARAYADAFCGTETQACCGRAGYPFDGAKCRESARASISASIGLRATAGLKYDPEHAETCLSAFRQLSQHCEIAKLPNNLSLSACQRVFHGDAPAGSECQIAAQCAEEPGKTADCAFADAAATSGQCRNIDPSVQHGKLGDACRASCTEETGGWVCSDVEENVDYTTGQVVGCFFAEALFCDPNTKKCTNIAKLDESCEVAPCASGNYCSEALVCKAEKSSGACQSSAECTHESSYCAAPAGGDGTSSECVPKKADGSACEFSDECQGGLCEFEPEQTLGVCRINSIVDRWMCSGTAPPTTPEPAP